MALEDMDVMPAETQAGLEEKLEKLPVEDRVLLHDGTEREVPRPVDEEKQKENYSGKKKAHGQERSDNHNAEPGTVPDQDCER